MNTLAWMAVGLGCAAAMRDIHGRVIPNWLNVAAIACGLAYHAVRGGAPGAAMSVEGALVGFGVFLGFYAMGAMGGGDVKLMAAFGALLGPSGILVTALLAAIIGGLVAAATLALDRRKRTIPYGPSIVLGAWLALLAGR